MFRTLIIVVVMLFPAIALSQQTAAKEVLDNRQLQVQAYALLYLTRSMCGLEIDVPKLKTLIDQIPIISRYGSDPSIFEYQQQFIEDTKDWTDDQHAAFCVGTETLAMQLELLD